MSFSSNTMHISSIRRTCSSLYPWSSPPSVTDLWVAWTVVSTSGKSRRTLSAVTVWVSVMVVDILVIHEREERADERGELQNGNWASYLFGENK